VTGGLRGRLRNLEREVNETLVVVQHEDGTTSKFTEDEVTRSFVHEMRRIREHVKGEEPGQADPFVVALRTSTNLEALMREQGTMVGHLLGEDEVMRGVRERPGPPVSWNAEGTVCS
jgi:hypothetical protein